MAPSAAELIASLQLSAHPEGGWYRRTWAASAPPGGRPAASAIYFLLRAGERSHWHHLDAHELWHFYAGAPLMLAVAETAAGPRIERTLGVDVAAGHRPQLHVPAGHWQTARSTGNYTLVGCTVAPAFSFDGFTLAAPGFDIH